MQNQPTNTAKLLDGKKIADSTLDYLAAHNVNPMAYRLVVFSVGGDPASRSYIRSKQKACERVKLGFEHRHYDSDSVLTADLIREISSVAQDNTVGGIIVQLPLPDHLDTDLILQAVPPCLDVDCFNHKNRGMMFEPISPAPCTPRGCIDLLEWYSIDFTGKHVVIIGRSNIVGKPLALMLMSRKNCTVTVCNSHTQNLADITRMADIIVCAVGKPNFLTADMVSEGAVVVDVGINRVDGKLVGDVDFEAVRQKASWITPVPGGVGRMTVAELMLNVFSLTPELSRGLVL